MSEHRAVCATCGSQYPTESLPDRCIICDEERQYVGLDGQRWTQAIDLLKNHKNTWTDVEPGVFAIGVEPKFGIGQRCYIIKTEQGNVLFDIVGVLDDTTKQRIKNLGGLHAIYFSHPHYYGNMADWAAAFGCKVYLPTADRQWVTEPGDYVEYWSGDELKTTGDSTVIRVGGHFPGSCVLHWPQGSSGRGSLFTGDTIQVVPDRSWVSFMYSYPNLIPLPAHEVARIRTLMEPWKFDKLHGAFASLASNGSGIVQRSAKRYIGFLDGTEKRQYF
ncbi:hypothetical protein ABBQ32_002204 [Trebouxia sp. C0010 RCD-2024]